MKIILCSIHFCKHFSPFDDTIQFEFLMNKFGLWQIYLFWLLNSVIKIVANWSSKVKFVSYSRLMAHPLRTSTKLKLRDCYRQVLWGSQFRSCRLRRHEHKCFSHCWMKSMKRSAEKMTSVVRLNTQRKESQTLEAYASCSYHSRSPRLLIIPGKAPLFQMTKYPQLPSQFLNLCCIHHHH